jgi:uncharacterized membrane protein YfcA
VALPLAYGFLVPHLSGNLVKMTFAVVWMVFGVHTLLRLRRILGQSPRTDLPASTDRTVGITVGVVGGVIAATTGVGIDMLLYMALILVHRTEVRRAVATSVILMAHNSLVGTVTAASLGRLDLDVLHHWLAAAPVVVIGAPIGAMLVQVMPRGLTLAVVSVLCLIQFFWTCHNVGWL